MMTLEFVGATGSEFFVPASGAAYREQPIAKPTIRVTCDSDTPTGSMSILYPTDQSLLHSSTGTHYSSGRRVLDYSKTYKGGCNYGPEDLVRSCSFAASSPSDATQSVDVYVRYEALNGARVENSDVAGNLAAGTTKFTASVFYWALGSVDEILTPSVGSTWTIAGQSTPVEVSASNGYRYTIEYYFTGSQNSSPDARTETVHFYTSNSRKSYVSDTPMVITQEGLNIDLTVWPIWKDTDITVSASSADITIYKGDNLVFDETFYAKPGESNININVNKLVEGMVDSPVPPFEEWLSQSLTTTQTLFGFSHTPETFTYQDSLGNFGRYDFIEDYSGVGITTLTGLLNCYTLFSQDEKPVQVTAEIQPITLPDWPWTPGQFFLGTFINPSGSDVSGPNIGYDMYSSSPVPITVPGRKVSTFGLKLACQVDPNHVLFNSNTVRAMSKRVEADYVLYFQNPAGGWLDFPFPGKELPGYDYQRYSVINPRLYKYDYKTGKEKRYKLSTQFVGDQYSTVMDWILASPRIYLHDIKNNRIPEVRIDTTSLDCKTFRNQDRMFPSYDIEVVECSQRVSRR